ncbi:MAG: hypothetical protein WCC92_18075 [Candidatus Korobacteraceae bacterium]
MPVETLPEISNKSAIKLLHIFETFEYDDSVTEPISQILKAMKQRVEYEARQLKMMDAELEQLAEAYHRYEDLSEASQAKARLLDRLEAILGKTKHLQYLKLWEVLELYLNFVPEAQVADILGFLEWVGYKSTRQAIESTVKTHNTRFAVRKEGWDRFISLARKETNAAATRDRRK